MGIDFSHCNARWGYFGFMIFREKIANACGLQGNLMEHYEKGSYTLLKEHDIFPFIDHSDCDGELSVKDLKKVCPVIEKICGLWLDSDPDKARGLELVSGMKYAISENEPLEFM